MTYVLNKWNTYVLTVITFVLHPLSHCNSVTEPRAWFFLSLLEYLIIDFLTYFILFIIDVYSDMATHDKLIFPSATMRILCHFSVPFPSSNTFLLCVPLTTLPLNGARHSFDWGGPIQKLLPLLLLHPHLLPPFLWAEWL